jgi:hypothetical protein
MNEKLNRIIAPMIECECSLREHRMALHEMYALAVANAPENETDNFTAKKLAPTYLALCNLLENIQETQ